MSRTRIELDNRRDHDEEDVPFLNIIDDEPAPATATSPDLLPPCSPPPRRLRHPPAPWQAGAPSTIIILITAIKFLVVTSGMLMLMPMYRLIEDAFCHVHYDDDSSGLIDEMKCKVDEVQSPLAYLMGWLGLVGAIMNLIVSYPYGILADRIGRKPTVLLSYGGLAFSFSTSPLMLGPWKYTIRSHPYILLGGSLFTLIGGGVPVLLNTLYAIATDVSTEENKASNFLYLTLGASTGGLLGPLIAGLLMERWDPWAPITVVLCTIPCVFGLLLFVPETLTVNVDKDPVTTGDGQQKSTLAALRDHIVHGLRDLRSSLQMLRNPNIPLCLVTFFFSNARFTANTSTLAQYISKNFGWTLAETSVLLSPLGIVHLAFLAGLPWLSGFLMKSPRFGGLTSFRKDLFLARASLFIIMLSALIRGISSHGVGLFLFGLFIGCFAAESPLVRATVSTFVEPSHVSRLYALAAMAEVVGAFAGGPVLAWCFDRGIKWKGAWTGLPWFYLAFTCFLAWAAMLLVRQPKKVWGEDEIFGDGDEEEDITPRNPIRLE